MRKIISFATILLVVMNSLLVSAEIPNSCFWCVSVNSVWDSKLKTCSKTGVGLNKAEECSAILDLKGLDLVFA